MTTSRPPYDPTRQCEGTVYPADAGAHGRREPFPRRCMATCTPWLPELPYCAVHVPANAVLLINQRREAWERLERGVWAAVLEELPYTGEQWQPEG